jgi:hypothetical protein
VGDYTAGLAEELRLQGHEVLIIAVHDKFIGRVMLTGRNIKGESTQILRLPATLAWEERIQRATQELDSFDPEWVSLQFVCYGFHPKGLIHGLASKLKPLFKKRKLHMMFHEIWLCKELGWGWKQCAVGALQRHFIRNFVAAMKPNVIHTSNALYEALLRRNAIAASELALFGNIPISEGLEQGWIVSEVSKALGRNFDRESLLAFGLFGALHSQWPPEPLLTYLHRGASAAHKAPVILSIGRMGDAGVALWDHMVRTYSDHFAFVRFGEQSPKRISEYLSWIDYGLSTTPRATLGKSGTVIAMWEHGLPVIVNRDDVKPMGPLSNDDTPYLISCDPTLERRLQGTAPRGPRQSRRPQVARKLIEALEHAAVTVCCA